MLQSGNSIIRERAFTWGDNGQVSAIYLEPTSTYVYSSVRYYKANTNPNRYEYFPTVQRMSTNTGTLQYAYSINITRAQTLDSSIQRSITVLRSGTQDNIFGCQPIFYTKITPNEIRFAFYRLVVNADYTIASQVFVEILESPRCLDLRVQSVTSFYVLALESKTLYKNHLIRIYDMSSAGASMTRYEFTYISNYRIYDGVILPDYSVYYIGATIYSKLSNIKYFTYIMSSDISLSCSTFNMQPIITSGTLAAVNDLSYVNLGVSLISTTTFKLSRSTNFSLLAQNISLYSTNYTKFCDPIPKLWFYNNFTGVVSTYVMQSGNYLKNLSSYFLGDENCMDRGRTYSITSLSAGNLPFVFNNIDNFSLQQTLFQEIQNYLQYWITFYCIEIKCLCDKVNMQQSQSVFSSNRA
ncbi:UNKNOWN [Stylonychia lemnae]|uniref:Uncharacterized protein n=1 Tax=Stylonychia lemnae TaxID=5949 RepID=A0A078AN26_STYLE|nr:UNKNOWN [Stylonychia lemnae]|eukprot:CDW82303.1 UNKNOWN [Stylonychia lemnae]